MASSSEEYTVPESRNENPVWTEPGMHGRRRASSIIFTNTGAIVRESWPCGVSALASC